MIAIPIRYRRTHKALFVQKLQHALPSFVVLGDGIAHLSHDPSGIDLALGIVEVGVAVLVIGSVTRGFRELRQHTAAAHADQVHAHGIDWIDLSLAAMLSIEAYAKYHATAQIPRPTILLAVAMFAIGMFHGRIAAWGDRRRELRVGPEGISVPGKRGFSRLTLAWAEVASIELDDRAAVVAATDGRSQRIELTDAFQPKAVRDALMSARTLLDDTRHAASASIESISSDK